MQQATAMTPRKVAIFDFDGTIVDGQSGALFTTYLLRHGIMRLPRALHLGWWGLRYKLHLPYRQSEARELVFGALADLDPSTVDEVMHRFHDEVLLPRYRAKAREEVARRRAEGCVTLLVSATFKAMADVAARTLGMDAAVATLMLHRPRPGRCHCRPAEVRRGLRVVRQEPRPGSLGARLRLRRPPQRRGPAVPRQGGLCRLPRLHAASHCQEAWLANPGLGRIAAWR